MGVEIDFRKTEGALNYDTEGKEKYVMESQKISKKFRVEHLT
jgi:hypothetical protein